MGHVIFLIEAEAAVRNRIQPCLEQAGYSVRMFSTFDVLSQAQVVRPELILAAVRMPDGGGMELCRRLRQDRLLYQTPLIFLIDPAIPGQRILALESGADDALPKTLNPGQLVACVQAVLRRQTSTLRQSNTPPDIAIDIAAMRLIVRGEEVQVTSLEFRLIQYLSKHQGQVFTRDLLLDAVWGDMQFVTPRSVDACIRRIRKKIEPDPEAPSYLRTVRGTGYRLDATTVWQAPTNNVCGCKACKAAVEPQISRAQRRA